jgi:hypothetical protein
MTPTSGHKLTRCVSTPKTPKWSMAIEIITPAVTVTLARTPVPTTTLTPACDILGRGAQGGGVEVFCCERSVLALAAAPLKRKQSCACCSAKLSWGVRLRSTIPRKSCRTGCETGNARHARQCSLRQTTPRRSWHQMAARTAPYRSHVSRRRALAQTTGSRTITCRRLRMSAAARAYRRKWTAEFVQAAINAIGGIWSRARLTC